ncbi:MAG TPA: MFS transporter [Candidatus Binataceae bacterium]|nr:MFS transporter [Candidatus Binataceae bacterium]
MDNVARAQGGVPIALLHESPVLTPLHYRVVALCFLAWIFDFFDLVLYSFLLVGIARELHLSPTDSSLVLGFSFLMTAIGGVSFGLLGDRVGRKPVIVATTLIYAVGTLLCSTAHSLAALVAWRTVAGLGIGGEWAAGQSMIAETIPARHRARYACYVQTGVPLGILFAAIAGGFLQPALGWRAVFMLAASPALVVAAAVWMWLPESDVWTARESAGTRGWRTDLKWLASYQRILLVLFFLLLVNSEAYWFTYSWLPGYLELSRHLSSHQSGRLMIGMQIGGVLGYLSFGLFADRFGRRPVFSAFGVMMALGLLPVTIFWRRAAVVPGLIAASMALTGFGTGIWSGAGTLMSELFPTRMRNTILGLLLNVTRGIQFFTPLMITALSTRVGFAAALAVGSLFAAAGTILVWMLPETRGRPITSLDGPAPPQ